MIKKIEISLLITHFGLMTALLWMKMAIAMLQTVVMLIKGMFITQSDKKFLTTPGKAITAAFLPMVKLGLARVIVWSVMEQIRGSCPSVVRKYSNVSIQVAIQAKVPPIFNRYLLLPLEFEVQVSMLEIYNEKV